MKSLFLILITFLTASTFLQAQGKSRVVVVPSSLMNSANNPTREFQKLIDNAPNKSTIKLPVGTLKLSAQIKLKQPQLSIVGVDSASTKILFTGSNGGFTMGGHEHRGELYIADLEIATSSSKGGTAVNLTNTNRFVPPSLRMSRVNVVGQGQGFWNYSVKMHGGTEGHLRISDCYFSGKNNGRNGTQVHIQYSDNNSASNGNKIRLTRNHIKGADKGLYVPSGSSEGQFMVNNIVEDVRIGGYRVTPQPAFNWYGCRIIASNTGLLLDGPKDTIVDGSYIQVSNKYSNAIYLFNSHPRFIKMHGNYIKGHSTGSAFYVPQKSGQRENKGMNSGLSLISCYIKGAGTAFHVDKQNVSQSRIGGNIYDGTASSVDIVNHRRNVNNLQTVTE